MSDDVDFSKAQRGPVIRDSGKTRITIFLDDDILQAFRVQAEAAGKGYQTLINENLRACLDRQSEPLTVDSLRRVLSEYSVQSVLPKEPVES